MSGVPESSRTSPLVAVFGSSTAREHEPAWRDGFALGRALASRGAAVATGGYSGVMTAVSRGAHEAGGHVVGVTVELFESRSPVNPWVIERVHTPDLFTRIRTIVDRADGFVVGTGSVGTLAELFLTWNLVSAAARPPAPIVLMGAHWRRWLELHREPEFVVSPLFAFLEVADTPEAAAERVLAGIESAKAGAR